MPRCSPGGSEVMVARRPPSATALIALRGATGCRVGRGSHSAASRDRADLFGPILVVVVDDVVRPQRAYPLPGLRGLPSR